MHRTRCLLSVMVAGSLLSACAYEAPTDPSSTAPNRPALNTDGGGWMGGGGKTAPDSTTTTTTTSESDAGGGWMGGGGKVAPDSTTIQP